LVIKILHHNLPTYLNQFNSCLPGRHMPLGHQ